MSAPPLPGAAERVGEPAQRARRREHHAHAVPAAGHGVAEGVHARLAIGRERVGGGEDDAGRAEHDRHGRRRPPVDADAERARRLVARPRGDRHAASRDTADIRRLQRPRQPGRVDLQRLRHLLAPAPPRDVEQQRARGVGDIGRVLAAQPQAHVVLGQHHAGDPGVDVRLVARDPAQLGGGEARQRAVAGQGDQALEADGLLDLRAFGPVRPSFQSIAGRSTSPAASSATRPCICPVSPIAAIVPARPSCCQHGLGAGPPVRRVLLGPAGARRAERMRDLGAREHRAVVGGDEQPLDRRRPDVEAGEQRHGVTTARRPGCVEYIAARATYSTHP